MNKEKADEVFAEMLEMDKTFDDILIRYVRGCDGWEVEASIDPCYANTCDVNACNKCIREAQIRALDFCKKYDAKLTAFNYDIKVTVR